MQFLISMLDEFKFNSYFPASANKQILKYHVLTCHLRITSFSTTEVFLKHREGNKHMSEADPRAGSTNTFLVPVAW